jgi:hypothetical protein
LHVDAPRLVRSTAEKQLERDPLRSLLREVHAMRRSSPALLLTLAALCLLAWAVSAADTASYKFSVPAGSTEVEIGGHRLLVETSDPVIIYVDVDGDLIVGAVEPVERGDVATVTVTLVGPPDRVLFRGRITEKTIFREVLPHETGHGEM